MYKSFYMNMSVQGIGRNFFICLIAILLFASCKSYKKSTLSAGCGNRATGSSTGELV